MKKFFTAFLIVLCSFSLVACGNFSSREPGKTIKVGGTPTPHAEILNYVKPILAKENINLIIIESNDYIRPNLALADKELDANFYQHIPYLDKFNAERNLNLVKISSIHFEPMGIYSNRFNKLSELPKKSSIAIPNDPTNAARALLLLAKAGLIELKENSGIATTKDDIISNPKNLDIREVDAPQLPRALTNNAIAVINANYALEAKLNPLKDSLFLEDKESPYVNILVSRQGEENRPELQALTKALTSPEAKKFIKEKFKGAIIPAF